MTRILTLAAKDWSLFLADRRAACLAFVVPIVLASGFGTIFDRKPDAESRLPVLLVVEGNSRTVLTLADELCASERLEVCEVTRDEATHRLAERRPGVAILVTDDLARLAAWQPGLPFDRPELAVWHNPLCAAEAKWAAGIATECVMRSVVATKFGALAEPPFRVVTTAHARAYFNGYAHSFSGMSIQYLLFFGLESGLLFLRERNRGVWRRLSAAPVSLGEILGGKVVAIAALAIAQMLATFAFGAVVFGVGVHSFAGFALLAAALGVLAAGAGLLVASLGRTEARARGVSVLVILGMSMLGGLWVPSFLLPGWLRDLEPAFPTTWAMRGLDGVTWQGRGLLDTLPQVAVILGFAGLCLGLAYVRFRTTPETP